MLWENSAPSSGLSTALTLDGSSYSYVYVEALYSNATKESQYTLIDVKNTTSGYISAWKIISGTNWYGACRPYTISNRELTIANGGIENAGAITTRNALIGVPIKIYGIK